MKPKDNGRSLRAIQKERLTDANSDRREEVARRAYQIWEASGRQPGRDLDNWLAAERQIFAPQARRT